MTCKLVAGLLVVAALAGSAPPKQEVKPGMTWSGSVENEKLPQPTVITNAKALEEVWKAWNLPGAVPKIDFAKEMVVGVYSSGSVLKIGVLQLDDKGNLQALGFGTRDLRPGFRYVLATVSREGVKSVNGKALPKD